jgi:hypothetical protein
MRKHFLVVATLLTLGTVCLDAADSKISPSWESVSSAQEFTGIITGRIVDPANAVMSGVSITVEGAALQGKRTAKSEANGSYRLLNLPQGEYRVTYQKAKFKKIVYEGAKVEVDKTVTMNVTMQIAEIEETVTVTGSSPIVDVKSATVGTNFGVDLLNDIPNQRDIMAILAMTPGITLPRMDVGGNTAGTQSGYRAYGMSGQSITTVNGVNITASGDSMGAYIDYGALAEAKVSAAANAAEVAGAGAAVTMVVKSGSNKPHGEWYADIKPSSYKKYDGSENFYLYRDLNGQLGGPFIKDKFWYFVAFRDQYNKFSTAMSDKPASQGGVPGQPFTTETTDYTLKLNYQLDRTSTVGFMTQWGRKLQPNRFGSGATAYQYPIESTAMQDSWSEIGKLDYTRIVSNRATFDTSINIFASQFPLKAQTDRTPIYDEITTFRSGAYSAPSFTREGRWHYNANLSLYAGAHDMKVGYMYQVYAPQFTAFGAPGPAGTAGHFYIQTTNGVPTSFWTDNGPVGHVNKLRNHSLFVQDKFQLTSKLTLNAGLRFDQYTSSYPEQRFGVRGNDPCIDSTDCAVGPFAVQTITPARDVVTFNTLVPRVALIYDLFGNSRTALKASWGRYATNPAELIASYVNPIDLITKKYAWNASYLTADPAVGAARITPGYVATIQPILGGAQLTPATVDPNLKDSYTDELTLGADQQIAGDLRGYVTMVRKQQKNTWGRYDRLRTIGNYTPVKVLDPGPDGDVKTADDRILTVFETNVPPDTTDFVLTNKPIGDTYTTVGFGVVKRMSGHWQLTSGFDWTKRDLHSLFSEDPNTVAWNSNDTVTTGWTLKASGSYVFRWGILVAASYNGMKGEPYSRFFTVTPQYLTLADPNRTTPLAQGNMTIVAEKAGTYHLPSVNLVNIRAQKQFVIKDTLRLQLMFNVFNFTGSNTILGVNQNTGYFNQPTNRLGDTVVRLSTRFTF